MKWLEENTKLFFFVIMVIGGIIGVTVANYMDDGNWIVGLGVGAITPIILVFVAIMLPLDFGRIFKKHGE